MNLVSSHPLDPEEARYTRDSALAAVNTLLSNAAPRSVIKTEEMASLLSVIMMHGRTTPMSKASARRATNDTNG